MLDLLGDMYFTKKVKVKQVTCPKTIIRTNFSALSSHIEFLTKQFLTEMETQSQTYFRPFIHKKTLILCVFSLWEGVKNYKLRTSP